MAHQEPHSVDSDWEFEDTDENDELFTKATQHVQRTHDKLLPNDLLELYGLYKQATQGKCNTTKPGLFSIQARAKWSAWSDLADMTSDRAKQIYVEKLQQLDPVWYDNILKGIKPAGGGGIGWVVHSVASLPTESFKSKADHEKTVFDFVKDHQLIRIKEIIQETDYQSLDENGMGLIHWATDANDLEILEFLLSSGCPVDLRDAEQQQTALHYASSCGHLECVRLLLQYGADRMAQNVDGESCLDVAEDPDIRLLLKS